jgi:hypothetical protein
MRRIAQFSFLFGLLSLTSACFVEQPREGYYDREHARYYHEHAWHPCRDGDGYCR